MNKKTVTYFKDYVLESPQYFSLSNKKMNSEDMIVHDLYLTDSVLYVYSDRMSVTLVNIENLKKKKLKKKI